MSTFPVIAAILRRLPLCCWFATALLLAGCEQQEEIATYTVPSHESLQTPAHQRFLARRQHQPERILAAVVPHDKVLWFFKLQGPPSSVGASEAQFRELLKSVRFQGELARWTLPARWRELPGDQMRYKTLVTSSNPPMGVSVTVLPAGKDLLEGIRDNINRWRGQIELPMLESTTDLPAYTETLTSGDIAITLMDATGKSRPDPDEDSDITHDAPAEWTRMAPKQFTIAVFEARDGDTPDAKKVTISLSRARGSKLENVNRWRGQMKLGPLTNDELGKALQKFSAGSRSGDLIELKIEGRTMLGLMLEDGDQTVFVKLDGDPELAVRERKRFEEFAKSLEF